MIESRSLGWVAVVVYIVRRLSVNGDSLEKCSRNPLTLRGALSIFAFLEKNTT